MIEIVERKGRGHPDYICDAIAERISVRLAKEYLERFGRILHFNVDKGLLIAGKVERFFGGGRVITPMELIIGDRAVVEAGGIKLDIDGLVKDEARSWIEENLREVDPDKDMRFRVALKPGSEELSGIFGWDSGILGANDTSACVGYAPFTPTESIVFELERCLNSETFKTLYPFTGEDVKVMGLRRERELNLTIAMPFLAGMVSCEEDYFEKKGEVEGYIESLLKGRLEAEGHSFLPAALIDSFSDIKISLNTLDEKGKGIEGVYLSLLGTSAEDADSGEVGRGNRVNGVISLNRPMSTEAAAGKNPVSHVGKIYNILSHRLADEIYQNISGIKEVYVWLISRIGQPVDKPLLTAVEIVVDGHVKKGSLDDVRGIVGNRLARMEDFCKELIEGTYPVC